MYLTVHLKGHSSEISDLIFLMILFPQARIPDYPMRTEFLRKFAKIFATQYVLPVSLIRTVGKWEIFLKRGLMELPWARGNMIHEKYPK